jgi:L-iditol 2-dehydrogenase
LNLCPQRRWLGGHVDGGFAGYVKVPVANILLLPPTVTIEAGALTEPLACCVHGIMEVIGMSKEGWHPPFTVVSGPGPIGLLCAQVARAAGSVVIILGTGADASRFALARQLGFEDLIDVTRENVTDVIRERTGGLGVDVAIEAAGAPSSLDGCLALVNRRGTVLQIGLYGRPAPVSVDVLVLKEISLRGTFSSTPSSWITAIDLMGTGQVDTLPLVTQVRPLEDWSAGFDAARAKGEGKIVLTPRER